MFMHILLQDPYFYALMNKREDRKKITEWLTIAILGVQVYPFTSGKWHMEKTEFHSLPSIERN